jgi:hypothetical protein
MRHAYQEADATGSKEEAMMVMRKVGAKGG